VTIHFGINRGNIPLHLAPTVEIAGHEDRFGVRIFLHVARDVDDVVAHLSVGVSGSNCTRPALTSQRTLLESVALGPAPAR
jgi:hypothetical protein